MIVMNNEERSFNWPFPLTINQIKFQIGRKNMGGRALA